MVKLLSVLLFYQGKSMCDVSILKPTELRVKEKNICQ